MICHGLFIALGKNERQMSTLYCIVYTTSVWKNASERFIYIASKIASLNICIGNILQLPDLIEVRILIRKLVYSFTSLVQSHTLIVTALYEILFHIHSWPKSLGAFSYWFGVRQLSEHQ